MESLFPPAIKIDDDTFEYSSPIPGLCIAPNVVEKNWEFDGQGRYDIHSILSHPGGHFVTHSSRFRYRTFGNHVGQLDRLTFVAHRHRVIEAFFIDCRIDSRTFGCRLQLRLVDSPRRRLCIPCGVAHTFSNLEDVVTRNDLSIFVDSSNASWNVLDDDLSFWWTSEGIETAPSVKVNAHPLPETMVRFFYRLQQRAILSGIESAKNFGVNQRLPGGCQALQVPTKAETSEHNLVVPSTDSCETGFFTLNLNGNRSHEFQSNDCLNTIHTFLDRQGELLDFEVLEKSHTLAGSAIARSAWICNPAIGLVIPAGVRYRYVGSGQFAVREEHVLPEHLA